MPFTTETLNNIKQITKSARAQSNDVEYTHALGYLRVLLKDIPENTAPTTEQLRTLESKLVRFFHIRPSQFNASSSSVSTIYTLLTNEKLLDTALNAEEKLTTAILTEIFSKYPASKQNSFDITSKEIEMDDLNPTTITYIYQDAEQLKTTIAMVAKEVPSFDWSEISINEDSEKKILHTAADLGWLDVAEAIIASKPTETRAAYVNIRDIIGWTPLHYAATLGHEAIVDFLLKNGADPKLQTNEKNTPLILLSNRPKDKRKDSHISIAKKLLEKMDDVSINHRNKANDTALDWALSIKDKKLVALLVEFKGITLAYHTLYTAANLGWLDVIQTIFTSKSAEIWTTQVKSKDKQDWTPLHLAAACGHKDIVDFLLKNGADPNALSRANNTVLSVVTGRPKKEQMDTHASIVKKLLEKMTPDSVNAKAEQNRTALEWAIYLQNEPLVEVLVQFEGITLPNDIVNTAKMNRWTKVTAALEAKRISKLTDNNNAKIKALEERVTTLEEKGLALEKIVGELKAQVAQLSQNNQTSPMNPYRPSTPPSPKQNGIDGPKQNGIDGLKK